jgi:arsenical pump membrane protein
MTFIIGNPTNIYLAGSFGISFSEYFSVMALPSIIGSLTALGVLLLIFRKDLIAPIEKNNQIDNSHYHGKIPHKVPLILAIMHLLICIILLSVSDFMGIEMWIICVLLALSLTTFDMIYDIVTIKTVKPVIRSIKKEPYELIPFVLSMFIIVLALKENGITEILSSILITGEKIDGISIGFLSAISSNLLNNIPMSVLFERIIDGNSMHALYGAVIGSNIGAFISPVGALAGIMWNKILSGYGVKLSFLKFMFYGIIVAVPTLITTLLTLFFVL